MITDINRQVQQDSGDGRGCPVRLLSGREQSLCRQPSLAGSRTSQKSCLPHWTEDSVWDESGGS